MVLSLDEADKITKVSSTEFAREFEEAYSRKKILLLSLWYPLLISRYFWRAFQRRQDVELVTVGPYSGSWIPWSGGMNLPAKYAVPPTIQIAPALGTKLPYNLLKPKVDFEPDLVITVDAGIHWTARPDVNCPVVHVATDPHVLNYDLPRSYSDKFFNMQRVYSKEGDIYLPYAFDPETHFKIPHSLKPNPIEEYDAVLVGMAYPNRVEWVNRLRSEGISVAFENGPIFDEYRELANKAVIGLNWSSLDDMVARVFEIMAMGLVPVINRVTDLKEFFVEDVHYLGFSSMEEAVAKVKWAKENPVEASMIANNARDLVWSQNHTYDQRVQTIMQEVGLA